MRQDDYWEKFMESGRIEDYLDFRAGYGEMRKPDREKLLQREESLNQIDRRFCFDPIGVLHEDLTDTAGDLGTAADVGIAGDRKTAGNMGIAGDVSEEGIK